MVISHRHCDLWPCVCPCNPGQAYFCCSVKGKGEENGWCHKGKCSEVWEEQEMSIHSTLSWISGQSDCWLDSTGLSRKDGSFCEVWSEYTKCSHWFDLSEPLLCLRKTTRIEPPWGMSETLYWCETRQENEDRVSNKHLWVFTVLKE